MGRALGLVPDGPSPSSRALAKACWCALDAKSGDVRRSDLWRFTVGANISVKILRRMDAVREDGLDLRILSTKQGWTCELLRDGEPIRSDLVRMFEAIPAWVVRATSEPQPPHKQAEEGLSCDTRKIT